ncbi:MAG: threonylcarbamoyl-AMP synthase [Cyanobacteria bacterium]|nr:threonylcarbamoyl-AMP synthase [Cyanobacteriota bacterium]
MQYPFVTALETQIQETINQAAHYLRDGRLVIFPTETVYGLGALARSETAVNSLYRVKNRPMNHPVIVHLSEISQLSDWAVNIPPEALVLAEHFWPGPLTMVFQKHPSVGHWLTGGQNTIAIRIPSHPVTLRLLETVGDGIAAPSANPYGKLSPTQFSHIQTLFDENVFSLHDIPLSLDGGSCSVGLESSIINMSRSFPENRSLEDIARCILRPGVITASMAQRVLQSADLEILDSDQTSLDTRVPGDRSNHYAPLTPLFLAKSGHVRQQYLSLKKDAGFSRVMVWTLSAMAADSDEWVQAPNDAREYGQQLYHRLHQWDLSLRGDSKSAILIEFPDTEHLDTAEAETWAAVQDRLLRAAITPSADVIS